MAVHHVQGDELREQIWLDVREILMDKWDPIGVADEPFATDEYEAYIPKIIAFLRNRASSDELMDFLDEVATKRMGFTSQRESGRVVVESLAALTHRDEA